MEPLPPNTALSVSEGWLPGIGPKGIVQWLKEAYTDVQRKGEPPKGVLAEEVLARAASLAAKLGLRNRVVYVARRGPILRVFVVWWRPSLLHRGKLYLRVVVAHYPVPATPGRRRGERTGQTALSEVVERAAAGAAV